MLAQRSELVVMQASGFTRMQVALSVMKTAIPLVLLTMAIGEWVAPQGEQMARNYRAAGDVRRLVALTQQGLWAKDGNNFVYIERVKGDEELGGISIYAFNENRRLQSVRYAATAKFDPEHKVWRLSQVDESDLTNPKQITGSQTVSGTWKTNLTPDKLAWWRWTRMRTLNQRFAQLREISEVERSGRWTLSAQHVEQNLPAAIRGGDDADGAVVHLRPICVAYRWACVWSTGISFGFVFYGHWTSIRPADVGRWHPADHRRTVAKRQLLFLISLWLLMRKS